MVLDDRVTVGMNAFRRRVSWLLLVLFGGLAVWLYWPRDWAIRAIERAGGKVNRITGGPKAGEICVTLPDTVDDHDLAELSALDRLHPAWLMLRGPKISGRGLASLTRLNCLFGLCLNHTNVRDEDLTRLRELPNLEVLNLEGGLITDKGLESVEQLFQLHDVNLWGNPVTAEGVKRLQSKRPDLIVRSRYEASDDD